MLFMMMMSHSQCDQPHTHHHAAHCYTIDIVHNVVLRENSLVLSVVLFTVIFVFITDSIRPGGVCVVAQYFGSAGDYLYCVA